MKIKSQSDKTERRSSWKPLVPQLGIPRAGAQPRSGCSLGQGLHLRERTRIHPCPGDLTFLYKEESPRGFSLPKCTVNYCWAKIYCLQSPHRKTNSECMFQQWAEQAWLQQWGWWGKNFLFCGVKLLHLMGLPGTSTYTGYLSVSCARAS